MSSPWRSSSSQSRHCTWELVDPTQGVLRGAWALPQGVPGSTWTLPRGCQTLSQVVSTSATPPASLHSAGGTISGTTMGDLLANGINVALQLGHRAANGVGDMNFAWTLMLLSHSILTLTVSILVMAVLGFDIRGLAGLHRFVDGGRPPPPPPPGHRRRRRRVRAPAAESANVDEIADDADDGGGNDEPDEPETRITWWSDDGVLWNLLPYPDCSAAETHNFNRRGTNSFFARGKCECGITFRRRCSYGLAHLMNP